jgi:hypothetical protein
MKVWGKPDTQLRSLRSLHSSSRSRALTRVHRIMVPLLCGTMIGVPVLVNMYHAAPAKFGWQMYATATHFPEVQVLTASGEPETVSLVSFAARLRPEVDYRLPVTERICNTRPEAQAVRFVYTDTAREEVHACIGR